MDGGAGARIEENTSGIIVHAPFAYGLKPGTTNARRGTQGAGDPFADRVRLGVPCEIPESAAPT